MSDLISREKLKKEAESLRVTVMGLRSGKGILAEYAKHYRESFLRMIDEQPTVEPVRGEWAHIGGDEWCCSNCGHVISTEGSWEKPEKKFCEECGADMRKKVEE